MQDNYIYEPLKGYKNIYKDLHHKNTTDFFNELVKKSGVNISENALTIKQLNKKTKLKEDVVRKIKNYSFLRTFLIIFVIGLIILTIYSFYTISDVFNTGLLITGIVSVLLVALIIFLVINKLNPFLKKINFERDELKTKIEALIKEASLQMAPLNKLFTDYQHIELFKKTIPIINLDNTFNIKRYEYLVKSYGLDTTVDKERSTLFVKSGDISGNPFYIANDLVHTMGTKTYTGTIVVTYTTYITVNGKRQRTTSTTTLSASITKPHPYYNEQSYILYGNHAAPDLSFSREDSDAEHMDQKQIDRQVNRVERKLRRKARKSVKKGGDFTVMSHSEFEVLWHAIDRDNEVQFRLLFTPLAQKQLLDLMKDKSVGYGDNFDFIKSKKINVVIPEHLQMLKLRIDEKYYQHYDFKQIESKFINYNNTFFKAIYFGFAPILSIPLYQHHKPREYIYEGLYDGYVSFYEHEMIANRFNSLDFYHPLSKTQNIIKTKVINSSNNVDTINVTAYGYQVEDRVDYIPRSAPDGRVHMVPVHWKEFIPVSRSTDVEVNIPEEKEEGTIRDKIEGFFKKFQDREKLNESELALIGRYITKIIKKDIKDKK